MGNGESTLSSSLPSSITSLSSLSSSSSSSSTTTSTSCSSTTNNKKEEETGKEEMTRNRKRRGGMTSSTREEKKKEEEEKNNKMKVEENGIIRSNSPAEKAPSLWCQLKEGKDMLVNAVIRPPRANYDPSRHLGPVIFKHGGRTFKRFDFEVMNPKTRHKLQCSWWKPYNKNKKKKPLPCVIYMHGNASCRLESLSILSTCLDSGMTVFSFDFAGCGLSDGSYISLGHFERDDLETVIHHLRSSSKDDNDNYPVSTIGLWGRSMGAATALLHGDRDPSIAGMVLDSPFSDLSVLCRELVDFARKEGYTIPNVLVTAALTFMRGQVKSKAGFDIRELKPMERADRTFIPAMFAHANGDTFIDKHHTEDIHEKYAGDKTIVFFEGDHGTERPSWFYSSAGIFLRNSLRITEDILSDHHDDDEHKTMSSSSVVAASSPSPPWSVPNHDAGMVAAATTYSQEFEDRMVLQEAVNASLLEAASTKTEETAKQDPDEGFVSTLTAMGFQKTHVETALMDSSNDVDLALETLLAMVGEGGDSPK